MATKRDGLLPLGLKYLNQMVRVIGQNGEMFGVLTVFEAAKIADKQAANLVMIAPDAKPPVCQIVDWAKFSQELAKRGRKAVK